MVEALLVRCKASALAGNEVGKAGEVSFVIFEIGEASFGVHI